MPQENMEILGAFYEAWHRGDIDDGLTYVDPNVEVYPGVQAPDAETRYLGPEGFKDFFVTIAKGPWEGVTAEPKKIIETQDDRILSIDLWRFRGRDGIEISRELPNLFTFRDGLISRVEGFTNREEALEAAGAEGA
jgi:ketosteroid isomerase-like protein